jgi:hypothetical protein
MYAELHTLDLFLCIWNVSRFIIIFSYWQFSAQPCICTALCCCVYFIIINTTISISCKMIYGKISDMDMNMNWRLTWLHYRHKNLCNRSCVGSALGKITRCRVTNSKWPAIWVRQTKEPTFTLFKIILCLHTLTTIYSNNCFSFNFLPKL